MNLKDVVTAIAALTAAVIVIGGSIALFLLIICTCFKVPITIPTSLIAIGVVILIIYISIPGRKKDE